MIDAPLSEVGLIECEMANKKAWKKIPGLAIIIVSPLTRAVQTAYETFCNHPNWSNIKVIVAPDLREELDSPYSVPNEINKVLSEFYNKFPSMDTSLFKSKFEDEQCNYWFLENSQEEHREIYLKLINKDVGINKTY